MPSPQVEARGALPETFAPPFAPKHVQFQGPVPVTTGGAEVKEQRLVVGAVAVGIPFAVPRDPAMTLVKALHEALLPPFEPLQFQNHGPVPRTAVAVPVLQRLVVGAEEKTLRFDEPQVPLIAAGETVQV